MIVVICHCGHKMKVPSEAVGKTCKCFKCGEKQRVTPDGLEPPSKARGTAEQAPPKPHSSSGRFCGDLLIEAGLITPEQLEEALTTQSERGGRTFENLIELGHLDKTALHEFLSKQTGVPSIELKNYNIPREVIELVPKDFAQESIVLPIDKLGKLLTVGMACPLDSMAIAELKRLTGLRVKAMLCKFDDIYDAIRRYYPDPNADAALELTFDVPSAKRKVTRAAAERPEKAGPSPDKAIGLIAKIEVLPPFSGTLRQVKEAAGGGGRARDLAEIVNTDPSASAKVLSFANFPAYGLPEQVTSVSLAAVLLGSDGMRATVLGLESAQPVDPSAGFDDKAFRLRAVFCATAAMAVAKESGRVQLGEAYTTGLLHEIGLLALAAVGPADYAAAAGGGASRPIAEQIEAEEQAFGLSHAEAGYLLASGWKLPPPIAGALRFYNVPGHAKSNGAAAMTDEGQDLHAVLALAAVMTRAFAQDDAKAGPRFAECRVPIERLGVDAEAAMSIFEKTSAALEGAKRRKAK